MISDYVVVVNLINISGVGVFTDKQVSCSWDKKKERSFSHFSVTNIHRMGIYIATFFCDFSLEYLMCFPCTIQFVHGYNNGHLPVSSPISGRLSKCSMNDSTFENFSWPNTIIRLWMSTLKCFTECVDLCGEIAMARIKLILCYHTVQRSHVV